MKKFIFKLFIIAFPFALILSFYLIIDPYKVLYHYDKYFISNKIQRIDLNKDFISTQNFINKYDTYKYDSYIFGSSRSMHYHINDWKKHINGASFYHFNANYETLYGLEKKFEFLDKRSVKIKNALIIIDEELLASIDNKEKELISLKHPALSGQSMIGFELIYFKAFVSKEFLFPYLNLIINNKMSDIFMSGIGEYNDTTNEVKWSLTENSILRNPDSFYNAKKNVFFERNLIQKYDTARLDSSRIVMLINIKNILLKNNANYKIVISPLYDQIKMNQADLEILKRIFGSKNVFDFSGINEITSDMRNYYEESHYRPHIATKIMNSIYTNNL